MLAQIQATDNHAGRIISLGSALAKLAAAVVVPALCASRGGWRSAALALAGSFGAFNLLWQLIATELPDDDTDAKEQEQNDKDEEEEKEDEEEVKAAKEGEGEGQERVPTIREMYFAPVFQVIIWCTQPPPTLPLPAHPLPPGSLC